MDSLNGSTTFAIPPEYQSQIIEDQSSDTRSDAEILESLCHFTPVPDSQEKNIWGFWHAGMHAMPSWCQRNVINWVRLCGPLGWTVRILDSIPSSPNNALNYISRDFFPESFVKGTMDGPYVGPHSADFLRGACLYAFGGVFMDVGILLFRDLDRLCWDKLSDAQNPFRISVPVMYGQVIANHFVASRKGDPFIKRWNELFLHIWEGRNNYEGLYAHRLLLPTSRGDEIEESARKRFKWEFKVDFTTVVGYIAQVLCWKRLCMLEGDDGGFSGVEYWSQYVQTFDALDEDWHVESTLGFVDSGQRCLELLSVRRDEQSKIENPEEWNAANNLVWSMLAKSSMMKITHGKGLTDSVHLGVLWDLPENEGKDRNPGTFGELLRYGSVNFKQTRNEIKEVKAERPSETLKKGLLEV